MSCSKEEQVTPAKTDETETPATEAIFTPRTLGLTAQKVSGNLGNIKNYWVYIPDSYNTKKSTVQWPLVIFLHGIGEMGTDINKVKNVGLPKVVAGKQFIMLAPQCTGGWWNSETLENFLKEVIKKYNVDGTRIYVTGLSMGGYGAWDWAQLYPQQFAAVVPICGGGSVSKASRLVNKPVWAFHNADDRTVSVQNSRDMVKAIRAAGGKLVKYTENPTGGHNAWTKAYADPALYTWMLAQKNKLPTR